MRGHSIAVLALLGPFLLLLRPNTAHAEEQMVKVRVEVVLASNKDNTVDPPELQKMKESFQRQNFNFTSFKRLSLETVEVVAKKPGEIKLPNGAKASLRLLGAKDVAAAVRVEIPRMSAVDVELGRQGSVYQKAGKHVGGELILVLSQSME